MQYVAGIVPGIFVVVLGVVLLVMCFAAPPTFMLVPKILATGTIIAGLAIIYLRSKKKPPKERPKYTDLGLD